MSTSSSSDSSENSRRLSGSSGSSGSGAGVAVVSAASDCTAMSTLAAASRRLMYPEMSSIRRRDICSDSTRANSTIRRISVCMSRDRTTPKTSVSSTHNKSLVCTSVRWNDAYAVMRPVLRLVVEKTGEVIIGGIMTYSGESKICSTSRPVRKTKQRSSRSVSEM